MLDDPRGFERKNRVQHLGKSLPTSLSTLTLLNADKNRWMDRRTKRCLGALLLLIAMSGMTMFYMSYYCLGPDACNFVKRNQLHRLFDDLTTIKPKPHVTQAYKKTPTFEDVLKNDFQFNIENHDVMVFLHMQKTGGTSFGRHLVHDLKLQRKCVCHRKVKKRCTCLRPGNNSEETWLFSRYSTGWKCGLHADWTELTDCVDEMMDVIDDKEVQRRYLYITYLRDPVHRYISEFRHVGRGATWKSARLFCGGRPATSMEVPRCYDGQDWEGLTLEDFLSCDSNLANNRQTRMLADLSLVDCYNTTIKTLSERNEILLNSAKENLKKMVFFGLTEQQEKSQYAFEETFNLKFNTRFDQYNITTADHSLQSIDPDLIQRLKEVNHLDVLLYEYATLLFQQRYHKLKSLDTHFHDHFQNMGHMDFSWDNVDRSS